MGGTKKKEIDKDLLTRMVQYGVTHKKIAQHFGCSVSTIERRLKECGISRHALINEITIEELESKSISQLAKKYNCDETHITRMRRRFGVSHKKPFQLCVTQDGEEWRDIEGFNGIYQVSNMGRVRMLERTVKNVTYPTLIMSQQKKQDGYVVALKDPQTHKQRDLSVAKIVALAFIGEPPGGVAQTLHLNGDIYDNLLDNLAWRSRKSANVPINQFNRDIFEKEVYSTVRKVLHHQGLTGKIGYLDTDDITQLAVIQIWKDIDLWDNQRSSFYTFCAIRAKSTFYKQWAKLKTQRKYCLITSVDDFSTVQRGNDKWLGNNERED